MATLRIVQLSLGLVLALFFCLAVLTGIFLGAVAMVSRQSAARMADQLRQDISDKLLFVRSLVIRDVPSMGTRALEEHGSGVKNEMLAAMADELAALRADQNSTAGKIERMIQRLEHVEQGEGIASLVDRGQGQEERIESLAAGGKEIQEQVAALQEKIDRLVRESNSEEMESRITDMEERIDSLTAAMAPLQEEMVSMLAKVDAVGMTVKDDDQPEKEPVEHRLFDHLNNRDMQAKIEQLVTETLDREMSYDQVIEHLIAQTKGRAADIIAAHPSLTRDYIRYRRKNG